MQTLPKKELSLFDSTCLIVGIIIGAGIYEVSPNVATAVGGWWPLMLIWIVGGLLSLFGALGYAELATSYPQEGGDYVAVLGAEEIWRVRDVIRALIITPLIRQDRELHTDCVEIPNS